VGGNLNGPAETGLGAALDKNASIEAWLKGGSRRSAAFHVCNNGVHAGSTRDRADEVNAVRAAVKDLQQTVT
jgi:hypothetical protein